MTKFQDFVSHKECVLKILITNSAISLNLRLKLSFFKGIFEGPKCSRVKFSRPDKNFQNPQNFSPSKTLGYTVLI